MKEILDFLEQLEAHNTTERMHAHQPAYKQAKQTLVTLSQTCIDQIKAFDTTLGELYPQETIFRLARDARFSKDKSPYKTNMGIVIAPGGKKSIFPCYYIHLQPGNRSFLAAGLYRPEPTVQKAIRDRLVTHWKEFNDIISSKSFTTSRGEIEGDSYKRVPAGYDATHPSIDYIKHKDRLVRFPISDTQINTDDFITNIMSSFKTAFALNHRLYEAIRMMLQEQG